MKFSTTLNRQVTLNIGLLNNSKVTDINNVSELVAYIEGKLDLELPMIYRTALGEFEGHDEPTLVAVVNINCVNLSYLILEIEQLAIDLTQQCIAVQNDQFEALVYDPHFKGERYKFDNAYFIQF